MEPANAWQETLSVRSSETDFQKRLKLSRFFLWMQDAAATHAEQLGYGYEAVLEQNMAWILSRTKIRFFDYPMMGDTVLMKTWPKGLQQKLFFMRDYQMTGADGRLFAAASSAYILINTQTRRVLLPSSLQVRLPDNNGASAMDEILDKIPAVEPLSECLTLKAGYSAVDIMVHVNNARYVDWISDCFSLQEHQEHPLASLQINYLNEVKPGESVTLLRGQRPEDPHCWYLTGTNLTSGAKSFEAEVRWA